MGNRAGYPAGNNGSMSGSNNESFGGSIRIGVQIMPRDVILDSQGRAVENSLKSQGFQIENCRVGKFLEFSFANKNPKEAMDQVHQMVKEAGLYNPLIEKYELTEI